MLARANDWFERLALGKAKSIRQIADEEGVTGRYVSRLLPLALLAPDITESIIAGSQPIDLTAETLTRMRPFPLGWGEQREVLGI